MTYRDRNHRSDDDDPLLMPAPIGIGESPATDVVCVALIVALIVAGVGFAMFFGG